MYIGCQIEAPEGYGTLTAGVRYYYCGRNFGKGALLVYFYRSDTGIWRVGHVHLPGDGLEIALRGSPPDLKICARQHTLPPALIDLEGMSFHDIPITTKEICSASVSRGGADGKEGPAALSAIANGPKRTAEARLESIFPLLEMEDAVLGSDDPLRYIGEIAKAKRLKGHLHRLQYWFFCYVLHGRNLWALRPATHFNGTWDRASEPHADKKFGRRSGHGSKHGWPSHKVRKDAVTAYLRYCGEGLSMQNIYTTVLTEVFNCRVERDEAGRRNFLQRENTPFPTYGQFRYLIVKEFGLEEVQKTLYGQARMRRVAKVNDGNFTGQIANWMEYVEVDAYRVDRRAKAYESDGAASTLVVARAICRGTSARLGIGFSIGGETQEAYRAMLFSMAVPKDVVARLYGIPQDKLDWDMQGVPRAFLSDRGPAGQLSIVKKLEDQFPVKSITPSYAGQAKPVVESSNPRSTDIEGEPSYLQSDQTIAEMMKAEILGAVSENNRTNIVEKLPPAAILEFRALSYPATPKFFTKYLIERGRTSAQHIRFDEAVRRFCSRDVMSVTPDGVLFKTILYSSDVFQSSGLHKRLVKTGVTRIFGYHLSMVKTYLWIDVEGKLFELAACRKFRFDLEDLFLPISALDDLEQAKSYVASMTREVGQAARAEFFANFKALTGKVWIDAERRSARGKSKKSEDSSEANVLRGRRSRRVA